MSSGVQEDTTGTLSGRDGYSQFLAQSSIIRTVIINMWELWNVRGLKYKLRAALCTLLQNKETETFQLFVRHF